MVQFSELRMNEDKSKLVVDCFIEGLEIYADMYIKAIYVDYYGNREESLPSAKCIQIYENEDKEGNVDTAVQAVRVSLEASSADVKEKFGISDFQNGLFYVTVMCDGTLPATVSTMSCGYDNTTDYGIIVDWEMLYTLGMRYATSYNFGCKRCREEENFETFVLIWNSIKMAVQSCDFSVLERLWGKFVRLFGTSASSAVSTGCGCSSK